MNETSTRLESLLRHARRRMVLQRVLDALGAGLAASAAVAVVCVGVHYALVSVHPSLAWSAVVLPTAFVLLREALRPLPALDEVACRLDGCFDTGEILTSAWHVHRFHTRPLAANASRVMRLAEATVTEVGARLRTRRLRVSGTSGLSLAVLAAAALPLGHQYEAARSGAVARTVFDATAPAATERGDLGRTTTTGDDAATPGMPSSTYGPPRDDRHVESEHDVPTASRGRASHSGASAGTGADFAAGARTPTRDAHDVDEPAAAAAERTAQWIDIPRTGRVLAGAADAGMGSAGANEPGRHERSPRASDGEVDVASREQGSFALGAYLDRYLLVRMQGEVLDE